MSFNRSVFIIYCAAYLSLVVHGQRLGSDMECVPEVDGLVGEQAVGVVAVGQRQRRGRGVGRVLVEAVRAHGRAQPRLAPRPAQHHPLHAQPHRGLALQDQLHGRHSTLNAAIGPHGSERRRAIIDVSMQPNRGTW